MLKLSCSVLLLFSLSLLNPSLSPIPRGPSSPEWRIVWTGWMMQSSFWGTMQWAPPPVCPVTYTVCWDRHRMGQSRPSEQTFLPPHWFQVERQRWYVYLQISQSFFLAQRNGRSLAHKWKENSSASGLVPSCYLSDFENSDHLFKIGPLTFVEKKKKKKRKRHFPLMKSWIQPDIFSISVMAGWRLFLL